MSLEMNGVLLDDPEGGGPTVFPPWNAFVVNGQMVSVATLLPGGWVRWTRADGTCAEIRNDGPDNLCVTQAMLDAA